MPSEVIEPAPRDAASRWRAGPTRSRSDAGARRRPGRPARDRARPAATSRRLSPSRVAQPDPMPGRVSLDGAGDPVPTRPSAAPIPSSRTLDRPSAVDPDVALGARSFEARPGADAGTDRGEPEPRPRVGLVRRLPADRLAGPRTARCRRPATPTDDRGRRRRGRRRPPRRGLAGRSVLLASYASAVTLGLIWVLWTGRRLRARRRAPTILPPPTPGPTSAAPAGLAQGRPAAADRRRPSDDPGQAAPGRLARGHAPGGRRGPVTLERTSLGGRTEPTDGGDDALNLRLRLRNVSNDAVFAPLDEAFLRERERGGLRQLHRDRRRRADRHVSRWPSRASGRSSARSSASSGRASLRDPTSSAPPTRPTATTPEMTWRVRLRTGIDQTDDVGVRFRDADIKADAIRPKRASGG